MSYQILALAAIAVLSAVVCIHAALALTHMHWGTSKVVWVSHFVLFVGAGASAGVAVCEIVTATDLNDLMHLTLVTMLAGLSGAILSERRERLHVCDRARRRPNPLSEMRGGDHVG